MRHWLTGVIVASLNTDHEQPFALKPMAKPEAYSCQWAAVETCCILGESNIGNLHLEGRHQSDFQPLDRFSTL